MNFCTPIFNHARQYPNQLALRLPQMRGRRQIGVQEIHYGALLARIGTLQTGFLQQGYQCGDRVILVMRPCVELYALTLALLGLGMVPVFIDSGMSRSTVQASISAANARALITHRRILWLTCWWPALRPLARFSLEGRGPGWRPLRQLMHTVGPVRCVDLPADAHGLITFTSGSTGTPKGANRTHGSLIAQHQAIRNHWPDQPGDIDMPCFPVLVLHNLCCGMTTVMPPVDLSRPADADGSAALNDIFMMGVTRLGGAPAWLEQLARAAIEHPGKITSLREIVIGGAPVSESLQQLLADGFPHCRVRIIYGSTEAEPVADIDLPEALLAHGGNGYLVGLPAASCDIALVKSDLLCDQESSVATARVAPGSVGEILVRGAHVLKGYVDNPEADRENKIACADGRVWHRTGDTGWQDEHGRLWLAGRVRDRININDQHHDVYPIEIALERLPQISRAAIIQSDGRVALFLVLKSVLNQELLSDIQLTLPQLQSAQLALYRIRALPVDRRHNSKIDRSALRQHLLKKQRPDAVLSVLPS